MLLPAVLLLLSFSTVQCGECEWERAGFENMRSTIDSNLNGFRTVFPKDYRVDHHYKDSMLCADRCCVFPAAVILLDAWKTLSGKLWPEHLNNTFIHEITNSLETKIIEKNTQAMKFQDETEISKLPPVRSSPEDLLNLTSQLYSKWINVICEPSITTCPIPSLAPAAHEWMKHTAQRARLTTRTVRSTEDTSGWGSPERHSNGGPSSLVLTDISAWILLLCGRHLLL